MKKTILAKSKNIKNNQAQETLVEHNKKLLEILKVINTSELYSEVDKKNIIIACVCHDLGKINSIMQEKLRINSEINDLKNEEEIKVLNKKVKELKCTRHNVLSGAFLKSILDKINLKEKDKELIYKSILLHHGGYEDYVKLSNTKIQEDIYNFMENGILEDKSYDLSGLEYFLSKILNIEFKFNKEDLDYDYMFNLNEKLLDDKENIKYIMYKGLLNLIDHSASSGEDNILFYNNLDDANMDSLIKENILKRIKTLGNNKIGIKDIKFTELQENLRKLSGKNVLTVAFTGSGKTVADYRKSFKRKFFLVPNKISAESFYKENIFNNDEYVGLLHGDINLYLENDKSSNEEFNLTLRDINLSRNFCKPYIISTVDQLLLSMFKFPGYEKVFAAIKGSSITVDEVHLLEPRMFLILLYFIQITTKYFNVDFHLMTATLPEVYKEQMIEKGITFDDEEEKIRFIESNKNEEVVDGKNIKVEFLTNKKVDLVIEKALKDNKKILFIKNTINEVIECYKEIKGKYSNKDISVLHSRFKFEDKKEKYNKILKQEGDIWISTQAVEIALDLDYYIIISDLAPMDCLIQRMGRCNRHNKFEYGEFYILPNKDDVYNKKLKDVTKKLIDKELKKHKILTMEYRKNLLDEYYNNKDIKKYFQDEFISCNRDIKSIYGINKDKFTGIDLMLNFEPYKNIADNKKEASKLFRDIDMSYKVILEDDFNNKSEKLQLKSIQISKGIFNKLNSLHLITRKEGYLIVKNSNKYTYTKELGLVLQ